MNMTKITLSCLLSLSLSSTLYALPPQVEADRLGLAAKTAIDAKDYATALEKLAAMQKLGVKLPDTFYYHTGVALLETGQYYRALEMFDKYLSLGEKGKFYKEALEKYNFSEGMTKESTFIDTKNHLMWQDSPINTKENPFHEVKQYCENLSYSGYTDWYLPSYRQLQKLFDYKASLRHVSYAKNPLYWVSGGSSISFVSGNTDYGATSGSVRCVRDNRTFDQRREDCSKEYDRRIKSRESYYWYIKQKVYNTDFPFQSQQDAAEEKVSKAKQEWYDAINEKDTKCAFDIKDFEYSE